MAVKQKILIVDDDNNIAELISLYLTKECYDTKIVNDGEQALIAFEHYKPYMLLLDLMLPGIDGYQVCREIRAKSDVPIIMLTAKCDERDELRGFDLGIDEYITKPFAPRILVARVEAVLRRTQADADSNVISVDGIEMDIAAHQVKVDGEPIELSYKEFELLNYFLQNRGVALSREKILNNVWNYDYFGDARTIDTHVKKLRSKLGSKGDYIKTIWGMGYKWSADGAKA